MAHRDDGCRAKKDAEPEHVDDRPVYEPPRIEKKRSVSRATLFTGSGPTSGGMVAAG